MYLYIDCCIDLIICINITAIVRDYFITAYCVFLCLCHTRPVCVFIVGKRKLTSSGSIF